MVNLRPFRTMFRIPRPLKVGGLRPPTFPGTSGMGSGSFFFVFDLKKLRFQGLDFLFNNFLFVVWGVGARAAFSCCSIRAVRRVKHTKCVLVLQL